MGWALRWRSASISLLTTQDRTGLPRDCSGRKDGLSLGINSDRIAGISVAFGSGLAAVAAILILPRGTISVNEGYDVLINALAVCIIGGLGSTVGVVVASFLIGYAQMLTDTLSGPHWKMIVSLVAILMILVVKPSGLFGKQKELEERI